jgi:lipid-binding SYLF domain-containing protein
MFTGTSGGMVMGKTKKQILLLPQTAFAFNKLTADMKYELGVQIGLAAGPYGREGATTVGAGGHGVDGTFSYIFEEGAWLNIGINNYFLENVMYVNQPFYGGKILEAKDIVDGAVDVPKGHGVEELQAKLAELSS